MLKNLILKFLNLLSIIVILFSIMVLLKVVITRSGEAPEFMGYSLFRVMSGSMEPTMPTNCLIIVKKIDPSTLRVGDVISFYSRDPELMGAINTHRITDIECVDGKYVFRTKGDANYEADSYPTMQEDVIGKVIHSSVALGKLVRLLSNPLVFAPVIMIPLMIMLGHSLWDGFTLAKKLAREEEEAAVREAVEAIRQKQAQQNESEGGRETEGQKQDVTKQDITKQDGK